MSISLDAYRTKLISKILNACSTNNAERYIDTAVRTLEKRKVNGYIVARFIEKMIIQLQQQHLELSNPEQNYTVAAIVTLLKKKRENLLSGAS